MPRRKGPGRQGALPEGEPVARSHHLLDHLSRGTFRFRRLSVSGIDNAPVLRFWGEQLAQEETCLFHSSVVEGAAYLAVFYALLEQALAEKRPCPIVRFADGEYAFYARDLACNGLYRQAESAKAIGRVLPGHVQALREVAATGKLAPLIFPGNAAAPKAFSRFRRGERNASAVQFTDWLFRQGIPLSDAYLPFYIVYAGLASRTFASLVHGRRLAILGADFDADACRQWFRARGSVPELCFVEIPAEYVATRWDRIRQDVLGRIPRDASLCLVGAGAGALLVCADAARHLAVPAVDAGHVLNMMNGREGKSGGPRLYTLWTD